MRHEKRACPAIKECAGQARKCFGPGLAARNRVAGGQYHPVGVELELCNLAGGEEAVVEVAWL